MTASYLFELIHCVPCFCFFVFLSTVAAMSEKDLSQARGPDWKIERKGEDGTVGADYSKCHSLCDQYYVFS